MPATQERLNGAAMLCRALPLTGKVPETVWQTYPLKFVSQTWLVLLIAETIRQAAYLHELACSRLVYLCCSQTVCCVASSVA